MIPRARRVSVATIAALTVASVCLAADPAPTPAPDTTKARPTAAAGAIGLAPGKGGIGGQLGFSYFRPDRALGKNWFGDYSEGAQPRFAFHAHWRYAMNSWLRWQIGPGLTWTGYNSNSAAPFVDLNFPNDTIPERQPKTAVKGEFLTLLLPISAQLQVTRRAGNWVCFAGAGPGVYRVWVENHRKVLKDPTSLKLHRGLYPGGSAEIGVERFFRAMPSTSLELTAGGHLVLAQRKEQFIQGFNSNLSAVELRFGANYYFTPGDRKKPEAGPKLP